MDIGSITGWVTKILKVAQHGQKKKCFLEKMFYIFLHERVIYSCLFQTCGYLGFGLYDH